MTSTLGNIKIESKFKIIRTTYIEINLEPNQHGQAVIDAIIEDTTSEDVISAKQEDIKISDGDRLLFSGVIDFVKLKQINGVFYLKINAITHSVKLDIKKKKRSFQNKSAPYTKIFDEIIRNDFSGNYLDNITKGKAQGRFILQYDETNWQFLIRIVSHLGGVVIPDIYGEKPNIYIGLPNLDSIIEKEFNFQVEKDLLENDITNQNYDKKSELEHISFCLISDNTYDIGNEIVHEDKKLVVYKKVFSIEKEMLVKKYFLKKKEGVYNNFKKNFDFIGLSIDGTVLEVSGDKIKVHLVIDDKQSVAEANNFVFSAFYTTEGQTGLYLMPQVGDSVKLYLPEADEDKAFVRFINRTDGKKNKKTGNVDNKYLGNTYGKEIKMSAGSVRITAIGGGVMDIKMNVEDGIEVNCNREMKITSASDIMFNSNKTKIKAKENLRFAVNGSTETLDNITHFKGEKITINGTIKR